MKNLDRATLLHLMNWLDAHADMDFRNIALTTAILTLETMSRELFLRITRISGWSNFFVEYNIQLKHE